MEIKTGYENDGVLPFLGILLVGTGIVFHLIAIGTRSLGFILTSYGPGTLSFYDYGYWTVCDKYEDCEGILYWAEHFEASASKMQAGQAFVTLSLLLANFTTWSMCAFCFVEKMQTLKWIDHMYAASCTVAAIMFAIGISLVYTEFGKVGNVTSEQGWGFNLAIVAISLYASVPAMMLIMWCRKRFGKEEASVSTSDSKETGNAQPNIAVTDTSLMTNGNKQDSNTAITTNTTDLNV